MPAPCAYSKALAAWLYNYYQQYQSLSSEETQKEFVLKLCSELDGPKYNHLAEGDWNAKWSLREKVEVCGGFLHSI